MIDSTVGLASEPRNPVVHMTGTEGLGFDCITESWFDSIEDAFKLMEFGLKGEQRRDP